MYAVGTSEVHSFDESSPSGNDYLAEVRFHQLQLALPAFKHYSSSPAPSRLSKKKKSLLIMHGASIIFHLHAPYNNLGRALQHG